MAEALPEYPDSDFSDEDQSPLDIIFNKAADCVRLITSNLDHKQLLELYGLYKQATEGKCNTPKPGWFDSRGRMKWEAWRSHGDLPSDAAKEKYITLVQKCAPELCELQMNKGTETKEAWVTVSSLCKSDEPDLEYNDLTIFDAAREDCDKRITELLSKDPELCLERDDGGLTALHWAADRNATKSLKAALEAGCPIDMVDDCGQTALHYAASCGHIESTRILLDAGASLLKDEDDCSPLDIAADDEVRKVLEGAKS